MGLLCCFSSLHMRPVSGLAVCAICEQKAMDEDRQSVELLTSLQATEMSKSEDGQVNTHDTVTATFVFDIVRVGLLEM